MNELDELLSKIKQIESDPKNLNAPGSFNIYTASAVRKLDKLRREVASLVRAKRLSEGRAVNDCGYSGRQTNRR